MLASGTTFISHFADGERRYLQTPVIRNFDPIHISP
jgi:hypothetical protein